MQEQLERLRLLIDERIPVGGSEQDTRFTDAELQRVLEMARSIEDAASEMWYLKASLAMSERGGLEESRAGTETLKFVSLTDYRAHCMAMARYYGGLAPGAGSRVAGYCLPDVLGIGQ